jgi:hypothetical protein
MKEGDIVKIKNPQFPFQKELRYKVVKVLKTVIHCYEMENPGHIYKDILKSIMIVV